jgi:preprotein translocase subunit SecA
MGRSHRRLPDVEGLPDRVAACRLVAARGTDRELSQSTASLRARLARGEDPRRCLPEAFAVVSESALRALDVAVTDGQLIAGQVAFSGEIAEMPDGEGKGIAAILAAYLAALAGEHVHVVTLDDYLAQRDFRRARAILQPLGVDTRLTWNSGAAGRRPNGPGEVTYGSYTRFAADYLEDNLVLAARDCSHNARDIAIIDEADTVLIDESRSIVQVGVNADGGDAQHEDSRRLVVRTVPERSAAAPDDGTAILSECLVRDYFRAYRRLSGLTATATAAAAEFKHFYGMNVVAVPASAPNSRIDHRDLWYGGMPAKYADLLRHAIEHHNASQPVIVRAESCREGAQISDTFARHGLGHAVLRSGADTQAARIMAEAGTPGAVTILVDSAGRGYGIRLGGGAVFGAEERLLAQRRAEAGDLPGLDEAVLRDAMKDVGRAVGADRGRVLDAGGLTVLGTSRSGSARADDWVRGLAGQSGEPGETQFYIADEDYGVALPSGRLRRQAESRKPWPVGRSPLWWLHRGNVTDAYRRTEAAAFEFRRRMAELDDLAESQRREAYALRQSILENPDAGGDLQAAFQRRANEVGPDEVRELIRRGLLAFDQRWRDYLTELHKLYAGIPRDAKRISNVVSADFQRKANTLFEETMRYIKQDIVDILFQSGPIT